VRFTVLEARKPHEITKSLPGATGPPDLVRATTAIPEVTEVTGAAGSWKARVTPRDWKRFTASVKR
jgi:hypothetical protein